MCDQQPPKGLTALREREVASMTLRQYIAICGLFTQLTFGLSAVPPTHAGQPKEERGSRSAPQPREKGRDNTDAQWSADPDRGWVRTDEGDDGEKKQNEKPKQPSGNNKDAKRKSR
jgi:hypothetical protein